MCALGMTRQIRDGLLQGGIEPNHVPALQGPDNEQLPLSPRRNGLPVKLIDWSCLMLREYSTRALIELMQIGKTPSGPDPVLHHAPEAFNRIEVVATMRRQEMQPKLLVPVGQRRR